MLVVSRDRQQLAFMYVKPPGLTTLTQEREKREKEVTTHRHDSMTLDRRLDVEGATYEDGET